MPHRTNLMKENKNHGDIWVLLSRCDDVQVVVLDESIGALLGADQRGQWPIFFLVSDQPDKLVNQVTFNVTAVVPGNQDLALHVQEVDGREGHDSGLRLTSFQCPIILPLTDFLKNKYVRFKQDKTFWRVKNLGHAFEP